MESVEFFEGRAAVGGGAGCGVGGVAMKGGGGVLERGVKGRGNRTLGGIDVV